jgi:hypothetical protein
MALKKRLVPTNPSLPPLRLAIRIEDDLSCMQLLHSFLSGVSLHALTFMNAPGLVYALCARMSDGFGRRQPNLGMEFNGLVCSSPKPSSFRNTKSYQRTMTSLRRSQFYCVLCHMKYNSKIEDEQCQYCETERILLCSRLGCVALLQPSIRRAVSNAII